MGKGLLGVTSVCRAKGMGQRSRELLFLYCCCGNKLPQAGWVKQHQFDVLHLEITTVESSFTLLEPRCQASGSPWGYFGGSVPSLSGTALSMAHLNPEPGSFTTETGSGGVPLVFWSLSRWVCYTKKLAGQPCCDRSF